MHSENDPMREPGNDGGAGRKGGGGIGKTKEGGVTDAGDFLNGLLLRRSGGKVF